MKLAGVIGSFFKIDPLSILESDYFQWAVRLAAFDHAVEERSKAIEAASKKK